MQREATSSRPVRRHERERDEMGRPSNARPRDRLGRPLPRGTMDVALAEDHVAEDLEEALEIAVDLWDDERFFEAHELLEEVWHAAPEEDRLFWQGVIQVAVASCHHQRGNVAGAAAMFTKAADKLVGYPDVHHGIDVEQMRVFAQGAAEVIEETGEIFDIGYLEFPAMDDGPWVSMPEERR